jgi:glyoxylate/hydroxypyruvate reductase A
MGAPCVALLSEVLDMHTSQMRFARPRPDVDLRLGHDLGRPTTSTRRSAGLRRTANWPPLPNLKLVQSLAAGIDHLIADPALPRHLPLCASSTRRWLLA